MTTLLHIKSSLFGDAGQSSQLAERFIAQWQQKHPQGRVIVRDLVGEPIPHLDAARMTALGTPAEQRNADQQAVVAFADQLLDEIRQADQIVLGLPLYNFGVPSQMKAYFDHLARAGVTFQYTENGPVGLIDSKPVVLFATRGGLYRDSGADFQVPFVKQFLGFIGLSEVEVIYAEGLAMGEQSEQALAQARSAIDQLLSAA